ncbi:uncharacterized [Tachysurus ichikawai]
MSLPRYPPPFTHSVLLAWPRCFHPQVIKVGSPRRPDLCCPEQAGPPLSAFRKIRPGHQQACVPARVAGVPRCTKNTTLQLFICLVHHDQYYKALL